MKSFAFQAGKFNGPIELLLDLVEKRKMLVSEVSLSEVTDGFLKELENYESLPIPETTQFVYIASLLLLIKSKELLPTLDLSDEETENIDELKRRLLLYGLLRDQSRVLGMMFGKNVIFRREDDNHVHVVFAPGNLDLSSLSSTVRDIITNVPKEDSLELGVVKKIISLEEAMGQLAEKIGNSLKVTFSSYKKLGREEKLNVVVNFLAMLELVRRGSVYVIQQANFSDIEMGNPNISTPRYV